MLSEDKNRNQGNAAKQADDNQVLFDHKHEYENLIDILLEENNKLHLQNTILLDKNKKMLHIISVAEKKEKEFSESGKVDRDSLKSEALHWFELRCNSQRRGFLGLKSSGVSFITKTIQKIENTGSFMGDWYLANYPDVRGSNMSCIEHYVRYGFAEGRYPHPLFDTYWYLDKYRDVLVSGQNPFLHYLSSGWREGRSPNKYLSSSWYIDRYKDLTESGVEPMSHYYQFGARELRDPSHMFSTQQYIERNSDVDFSKINPLEHFLFRSVNS